MGKRLLQRKTRDRMSCGVRKQQDGCRQISSSCTDFHQFFEKEQERVILHVKMLLCVNNSSEIHCNIQRFCSFSNLSFLDINSRSHISVTPVVSQIISISLTPPHSFCLILYSASLCTEPAFAASVPFTCCFKKINKTLNPSDLQIFDYYAFLLGKSFL